LPAAWPESLDYVQEINMIDLPFTYTLSMPKIVPSRVDNYITRKLSDLKGMFNDQASYTEMLSKDDQLVYEVYEIRRPEVEGEMLMGVSVVHPGKVGNEFFMTKGHFHSVLETAEMYYCLRGEGYMVMETPEGDTSVEALTPGKILYVPPRWAHRSVCTSRQDDLVTLFVYPGNAGHDYGTIERAGFRKLVVEGENGPEIIDNLRTR
jgi:glucose-6-phosphate isomerase